MSEPLLKIDLNQLRWRCRRGMRELDLILSRFLEREYSTLIEPEQHSFARLLDSADPDLYNWLLARQAVPTEFAPWIERLQAYRHP